MKKSERENLKKAFNIPEPERKEAFVLLYNQKLKKNERKFNLPVFFRYASTAVFAVLIIGIWSNISKNSDFRNKFNNTENTEQSVSTTTSLATTAIQATTEENDLTTTTKQITQNSVNNLTTVPTNALPDTPVTMPNIPDFTPSVTAMTFRTKPETPTKPAHTITKAVNTTETAVKTEPVITTANIYEEDVTTEPTNSFAPSAPITTTSYDGKLPQIVTTIEPSENDCPSIDVSVGNDYTVHPSKVYYKSDNIIDISHIDSGEVPSAKNTSVNDLINSSDYIILGKIHNIIYTQINGQPYTQEDIIIYQLFKGGGFQEYDRISIYIPGGYMPVNEYETLNNVEINSNGKSHIYSSGGNQSHQNIGDICIFFINNGSKYIPDGAFEFTTKNDISIFQVNGSEYVSLGNNSLKFNIKSLLNI